MFEEVQDKNKQNPIANNPVLNTAPKPTLEDIFSETEQKEKPPVFQKKQEIDFDDNRPNEVQGHGHQKIFFLVFLVLTLILLGAGSFWGYRYFIDKFADRSAKEIIPETVAPVIDDTGKDLPVQKNDTQNIVDNNQTIIENIQATTSEENKENTPEISETALDSDNDGLTDEEEWQLGTAVDNVDTDIDGLFDREEVKVYKTNPKIADTDGDGYSDGDEVKGGYNPMGSGKLFDVNK